MNQGEWLQEHADQFMRDFPNTREGHLFVIYDPNWWERIVLWILLRLFSEAVP